MHRFRNTCADCRITGFDDTVGCASRDCNGTCIECLRMADGCHCTCRDIGFEVCPTYDTITNCACADGTVETHNVLTGCWVGFVISDDLKAALLALCARECPDDTPHFTLALFGSTYSFGSHTTTTNLNCPSAVADWTPIPVAALVPDFQGAAITHGGAGGACDGGAFFLSVADLGIIFRDKPGGAPVGSVSCAQEGGCVALMMRLRTPCSTQLILCPFVGLAGADFQCDFPEECEEWSEDVTPPVLGSCEIDFSFTNIPGTCPLTCTVTFGAEAPFVLSLPGNPQNFMKVIPGCTGDGTTPYVVRVQKEWPVDCVHACSAFDSDVSTTYFG